MANSKIARVPQDIGESFVAGTFLEGPVFHQLARLSQLFMLEAKRHPARSSSIEAIALAIMRVQDLALRSLAGDNAAARELSKIGAVRRPKRRRVTFDSVMLRLLRNSAEAARAMRNALTGVLELARDGDWSGLPNGGERERAVWESGERGRASLLAFYFDFLWRRSFFGAADVAVFGFGKLKPPTVAVHALPAEMRARATSQGKRLERWRRAIRSLFFKYDAEWSVLVPEIQAYRIVCECLSRAGILEPSRYFDDERVARGRAQERATQKDGARKNGHNNI